MNSSGATTSDRWSRRGSSQTPGRPPHPGGQWPRSLILVAVLIAGGCTSLGTGPGPEDTSRRDTLFDAVANAAVAGHLDLRVILGDDWERLGILGPYSDNDAARKLLGYDFDIEGASPWTTTEGGAVVVLGSRFSAVAWFGVPSDQIDLYCVAGGVNTVAAEDAIYEVAEDEDGYRGLISVPRPPWC